jgi:FHS family L-fucose permease-like MFS transporter
MTIMFPTIFALGIKDLSGLTKKASSFIVMMVAGGAVCPALMGKIADVSSMALGFIIPLLCYIIVFFFGLFGYKIQKA